ITAYTLLGTSGDTDDDVAEAKVRVDLIKQVCKGGDLFLNLGLSTENVRIVLHKGPYAHQALQGSRCLIAVAGAELSQPQGQCTVALQALIEHLDVARAIHRFFRKTPVFRCGREHICPELISVT